MKSCVFIAFAIVAVAFASEFNDYEEDMELIQDLPMTEDLMSVVHELRGAAPVLLQEHVKVVAHHASLIQDSKAQAYAHNFSESQNAIKAAIKSLNDELQLGHDHDVKALNNAKTTGNKVVTDADAAAKSRVRVYRDRACPTKRSEETATAKKDAAKKKMDDIADGKICEISTTWGDMDIDKSTAKYGTALRNKWDEVRGEFVKAKTEWTGATNAHADAVAAHQRSMAGFTTALGIEAQNVVDSCNAAHRQYDTLIADVQSNVNTRKQTFVAGLVITCYVDNIVSNAGAKKCADGARAADVSKWNIDGGKLAACTSNAANQNSYGPSSWTATTANCGGHKAAVASELLGNTSTELKKSHLLSSTFTTHSAYDLSFDIYPTKKIAGWTNILHFTDGENMGKAEDRNPAIWFHSDSFRLHIRQGRKGYNNDGCDPAKHLAEKTWTNVRVSLRSDKMRVYFNGKEECSGGAYSDAISSATNIKVYASDPWHTASGANIKNIKYKQH